MNRAWVIAGMVALLFHGLLLFGIRLGTAAVPLPTADDAVDVSLVAAAPAPAANAEPAAPEPPSASPPASPDSPPPPPPEPALTPVPPPPTVSAAPAPAEATPIPREHPPHREPAKPSHPTSSAPRVAAPSPAGPTQAGARGGAGSAVHARYNPKPPYPAEARRLGQQGRVLLEVQVSANGRATSVSVKRSSGFPILDNAAAQGVREWTFEPARIGGLPIASRADVPVNFSLAQ